MKRIAWLTDIHLNFIEEPVFKDFVDMIDDEDPDELVITGDIAESHDLEKWLVQLDEGIGKPIHFVLGNHDYYYDSIPAIRARVGKLCETHPHLNFLTLSGVYSLTSDAALIGHDGWGDARAGDYEASPVSISDYVLIDELSGISPEQRKNVLGQLGTEAAEHLEKNLRAALADHQEVWLATHVPPLASCCWYEGRTADDNWAPHFVCQAVGDMMLTVMAEHPDKKLFVLCGHTHDGGEDTPAENIRIFTGGAEYRRPQIERVFEIG